MVFHVSHMSRILVTGSTAYDLLLTYDGSFTDSIDPNALDSFSVGYVTPHFERHHGGTGANISWNLKLLRQEPLLVSTVGSDGGEYLALLEERGISTAHIEKREDALTATAIIGSDNREHQITFYHPGADAKGSWPDLADERENIGYAIVSPRDTTIMVDAMQWCRSFGVSFLFDPGQQVMSFGKDALLRSMESSSGVVVNAYEWSAVTERLKMTEDDLLGRIPFIVVTRGEQGVEVFTRGHAIALPSCKAEKVINPTGAGDALRAGILTGLAAGWSLRDAARLGAAMGSFAVECEGTLMDSLDLDHLWERARVTYGEDLPPLP
ncbi:MAG: PfkB [Candidatus Peribacteria bacterium GW2011_GWB1_54_5]|nr:MAG: PfkB [Candidatus Peribacteria bacterium GW2011_GWB1_54_5]